MSNNVEQLPLQDQLKQTLEEARVVLPGIQALFGFQLIVVFNETFSKTLTEPEQRLHLLATGLSAVSIALSMATTATHRQSQPDSVSNRLVKLCTFLLTASMLPLLAAISLDFYLVCRVITHHSELSRNLALGIAGLLVALWYVMPHVLRGFLKKPIPDEREQETSNAKTNSYVA